MQNEVVSHEEWLKARLELLATEKEFTRQRDALTRRGLGSASAVIKHGPLSFDATGRVAYLNDQMLELSAR